MSAWAISEPSLEAKRKKAGWATFHHGMFFFIVSPTYVYVDDDSRVMNIRVGEILF